MSEHIRLRLKPVQVLLQLIILKDVCLHLIELEALTEIDIRTIELVERGVHRRRAVEPPRGDREHDVPDVLRALVQLRRHRHQVVRQ